MADYLGEVAVVFAHDATFSQIENVLREYDYEKLLNDGPDDLALYRMYFFIVPYNQREESAEEIKDKYEAVIKEAFPTTAKLDLQTKQILRTGSFTILD